MCFDVGAMLKDFKGAPSFGKLWDQVGQMDPLLHGAIDDQSKLDDRVTSSVLGRVGLSGPAKYFASSAEDPTKAAEHHVLAGLAWAGGEAALGAGGAGGAGGAAADGTAMGGSVGTLGAADSSAASSELGLTATDVGGTSGATAGASAGAGSSAWLKYGETAAKTLGPTLLNAAMQPKPPKTKAPTAMPDPLAQEQAQRQKIIQQMARRGRASTILTSATNGSLGG